MTRVSMWLSIMALFLIVSSADCAAADPIVVFAGSASQPPLEEAAQEFESRSGVPVILHLGGSGAMLSQILLTGQGDIYIPGSPDYMQKAIDFNLIAGEEIVIAYLVPAILVPQGNPQRINSLRDLIRPGLRIGIADPESVCVGLYAVEIFQLNNMIETIRPNLRGQVESCAKAAAMLPLGTVDAIMGWREFAGWNPTIQAILLQPAEIPRLAYIPAARLRQAKNPDKASEFIAFLNSQEGQEIFRKWGYYTELDEVRKFAPAADIGGLYHLPEGW